MIQRHCPRTPPSSSYAHLPQDVFANNLNDVVRRITLDREVTLSSPLHAQSHLASHISTLPPEILAEIFLYCLPKEQFPVPSCTEAPLLLTHVSHQWRQLALAIPDLWAALHINYKDPSEDIPATELWLSRSGNRPLTLSVAIDFNEQPQQGILDAICRHSHRWRHIRFDFRHLLCPPMYTLALAQNNIPQLSTFEFHARDISNNNISQITHLLSSASQLREVTWVDDLADTNTLLELPLDRLSRLSLSMEHGILDYLQLLHRCSNLEHIRITRPLANVLAGNGAARRPPIFLSKLTSLNISYDLTGILDHLILPALRDVRIYAETDKNAPAQSPSSQFPSASTSALFLHPSASVEGWNPAPLLSLIDRSACPIASLSVSPPMTEETLLVFLQRIGSSLKKLFVENITVGDALVGSLTRRPRTGESAEDQSPGSLCPKLIELSLDSRVACSPGALAAMVASRLSAFPETSQSEGDREGEEPLASLQKIRVVDGHRDLDRLKEFAVLSRGARGGGLVVDVFPRKAVKHNTRNYFFRRKLCASR